MAVQIALREEDLAPLADPGDDTMVFLPGLAYRRLSIVNVIFYGVPGDETGWALIDAGLPTSANAIIDSAERRFGAAVRPSAIIMTHAHFDHAGSIEELAAHWDAPVYAHPLECPYLSGQTSYPPADPLVGGGMMALLSPLYPRSPVNVGARLRRLPPDGSVPGMPGWTWLHTPGHTPGHISLWRESDRTLIAGDAIVTTGQESVYDVLTQRPEMHGPPRYLTPDWDGAEASVAKLAALDPSLVISGHGPPVRGASMREKLHELSVNFRRIAAPSGRMAEPVDTTRSQI